MNTNISSDSVTKNLAGKEASRHQLYKQRLQMLSSHLIDLPEREY